MPTYDLNRRITLLVEEVGFDYIFSTCKWRGFGGETGAHQEAISNIHRLRSRDKRGAQATGVQERFESEDTRLFYGGLPLVGGPELVADTIEELAVDGAVDGVLFVFPDFIDGLTRFGEQVMPILRKRGLRPSVE